MKELRRQLREMLKKYGLQSLVAWEEDGKFYTRFSYEDTVGEGNTTPDGGDGDPKNNGNPEATDPTSP